MAPKFEDNIILTNGCMEALQLAVRGDNAHHQCETVFKAFARALRMAAERDERAAGTIPSTKGAL